MAHEFGHAMQARFGFAESGRGIQDETQADCLAGAWTAWVADGNSGHLTMRTPELDDVVRGFRVLRDDVGSDPDDTEAHGSFFDRVSAFYEGFSGGVGPCRDDFGADRVFTAATFTSDLDSANHGDAPYRDIVGWIGQTLPLFWETVFRDAFSTDFRPPSLELESDLTRQAYGELGDFAVATALSLPYALAARAQAGLSTDDAAATESAACLTGWYAADWYGGAFADSLEVTLSPGDLDEAVQFLLTYGVDPRVFPDAESSGFELVGAFGTGFLDGRAACDLTS
jgi:hypothetical protein